MSKGRKPRRDYPPEVVAMMRRTYFKGALDGWHMAVVEIDLEKVAQRVQRRLEENRKPTSKARMAPKSSLGCSDGGEV